MIIKDVKLAFEDMVDRLEWGTVRSLLKFYGFGVSQGVIKTREKINELSKGKVDDELDRLTGLVKDFSKILPYGTQAIFYYRLTEEETQVMECLIDNVDVNKDSLAASRYPFTVGNENIENLGRTPQLCKKSVRKNKHFLCFTGYRTITKKEELKKADLTLDAAKKIKSQDKVYIQKRFFKQFFDHVIIDYSNCLMEVRIDLNHSLTDSEILNAKKVLVSTIKKIYKPCADISFESPVNVYKALSKIYNDSSIGRVVELHFWSEQGAAFQNRLRNQRNKDIRKEEFQLSGQQASDIQIYKMAVEFEDEVNWETEIRYELTFNGTSKILHSYPLTLDYSIIRNCPFEDTFERCSELTLSLTRDV